MAIERSSNLCLARAGATREKDMSAKTGSRAKLASKTVYIQFTNSRSRGGHHSHVGGHLPTAPRSLRTSRSFFGFRVSGLGFRVKSRKKSGPFALLAGLRFKYYSARLCQSQCSVDAFPRQHAKELGKQCPLEEPQMPVTNLLFQSSRLAFCCPLCLGVGLRPDFWTSRPNPWASKGSKGST